MSTLQVGDNAPDFTLKNTDGKDVTLSKLTQNRSVVILFFPLAFTGVCTEELCTTRDNLSVYEKLGTQVVAISVDSFFTLNEFKKQQNYNFELLSDFNKEVAPAYGSFYEDFLGNKGIAKRSAFVVGTDGKIKYAEVLEDAHKIPNFDAVQNALK